MLRNDSYGRDALSVLTQAFELKRWRCDKLRTEYKTQLLALREWQVYRRGPDYVSDFDWNTPCGLEDAAAEREHEALLYLRALRLAFQMQRGIGNLLKYYTDLVLSEGL